MNAGNGGRSRRGGHRRRAPIPLCPASGAAVAMAVAHPPELSTGTTGPRAPLPRGHDRPIAIDSSHRLMPQDGVAGPLPDSVRVQLGFQEAQP